MSASRLKPMTTLADLYGPRRIYLPRAHERASDWLSDDPVLLDSLTGNQLTIAGAMPVVCSRGFSTPAAMELLEQAGLEPSGERQEYEPGHAVETALRAARRCDAKLVVQHAHPDDVLPAAVQWIDPGLLRHLNNKAKLRELAPAEHVPERQIVCRECFFKREPPELPVVIKAVTEQSSGGGVAVMICRTQGDFAEAAQVFARCRQIVVESFLSIARNVCVHFAAMPDARVMYLGCADQDVTDNGRYLGNWMQLGSALPRAVVDVARDIVRRGAIMGYRGIAGVDMAVLHDGRIIAIDLNFRVNGSTSAVLLAPALLERRGPCLAHVRGFKGRASFDELVQGARDAVRRGHLIPMSVFNPTDAGHAHDLPRMKALVLGDSKEEILGIESDLAARGLG